MEAGVHPLNDILTCFFSSSAFFFFWFFRGVKGIRLLVSRQSCSSIQPELGSKAREVVLVYSALGSERDTRAHQVAFREFLQAICTTPLSRPHSCVQWKFYVTWPYYCWTCGVMREREREREGKIQDDDENPSGLCIARYIYKVGKSIV